MAPLARLISKDFAHSVLDLACHIQAIPAPTFNEIQRASYFLDQFRALGLQDVEHDSTGNVLARLPGTGTADRPSTPLNAAGTAKTTFFKSNTRPLVISAHMDTVHPLETPLGLRRLDDRIIGPGIGDNAVGLAAVLSLARLLKEKEERLPGDLWLAINVGEEGLGDLRGIQAIVNRFGAGPLAYLVVEGMGLGTILHRGLGVERYRITVQTPGGHSWVDYGRPSAIHELCSLVTRLAALPLPQHPCTSLNVGILHGGTSVNTIASQAWLELDLRSEESSTLAHLVKEVQANVQVLQKPTVQVTMERIGRRLAGSLPPTHPLVALCRDALSDLGLEARLDIASTDANLPLSRGYPSVCVGITHGNHAHSPDEYILTAPVAQGMAQIYLLVTRAWEQLG
jgi:acetylornithine deacetylase/succinyl-diaminopimelate desuccinylase-like protein